MKKISVVIPLYNKEHSISDTINSVLSQSFKNFEIIVVDDGSNDKSFSVVENINDARIKLIKKRNKGVSTARNVGIKNATGEYIFFLDADDIILENCFEVLIDLVNEFPQAKIFTANFIVKESNDKDIVLCKRKQKGLIINPFKKLYTKQIFLRTGNMLIHYQCFDKIGLFNEELSIYEDLEFTIRLMNHFKIAYTPKIVFQYIRKYSELSKSKVDINREFASIVDLSKKGFYEKLLLGEYLAITIQRKIFFEKEFNNTIYIIKKNIKSLHFIILSYIFLKIKGLINRLPN